MRQRTTFFLRPEEPLDPALLTVTPDKVTGPAINAQREDRLTLGLEELPLPLARVLTGDVKEFHVRWVAPTGAGEVVSPLLSRLSPGLHVFYTPSAGSADKKANVVCSTLKELFGKDIDCKSTAESATYFGDNHSPQTTDYHFYSTLDDISAFIKYVKVDGCKTKGNTGLCSLANSPLDSVRELDLTYDIYSRLVKVTAQWPFTEKLPLSVPSVKGSRVEVGIMGADALPTLGPYEIGMTGHLVVLGQDDSAKPVMFAFPSRHREAPKDLSFSATFAEPTGLHPTLQLQIAPGALPPREGIEDDKICKLHTYLTLARHIFADRYQMDDELFLASKNLAALKHMTQPVDLEAPDYAVDVWGSAALIELAPPASSQSGSESAWTAEIPLHLRYLLPAQGGYQSVDLPYPAVFWACETPKDVNLALNPFDRAHIGYDTLFSSNTEFWHLKPSSPSSVAASATPRLTVPVRVPVLDSDKSQYVNVGTSAVIVLGFTWVLWKLVSVYLRTGYGKTQPKAEATKKTQ